MLRVDWAIACRYAEVTNNLATIIGAGIDHTYIPALPGPVQANVVVRIVGPSEEIGGPHTVACAALDPEMNELARVEGQMVLPPVPPSEWLVSVHVPMAVQFQAETHGAHRIEVSVDQEGSYSIPMHVTDQPPPGVAPAPPPPG